MLTYAGDACAQLAEALLRLALRCVEEDPEARPSMEDILGTPFTGVTGTKVQILTCLAPTRSATRSAALSLLALLVQNYRH